MYSDSQGLFCKNSETGPLPFVEFIRDLNIKDLNWKAQILLFIPKLSTPSVILDT